MTVAEINKALEAERELGVSLDQYAGEWVGVCDHEIVANAATLGELVEQLEASGKTEVEVIQVPQDPGAACFF
jgi:putative hemolysin